MLKFISIFREVSKLWKWNFFPKNRAFLSTLHKKWSFQLQISSVNVAKSAGNCGLVIFTEEICNGKLHFLCSVNYLLSLFCTLLFLLILTLKNLNTMLYSCFNNNPIFASRTFYFCHYALRHGFKCFINVWFIAISLTLE